MDYATPLLSLLAAPVAIYTFRWFVFGAPKDDAPTERMPRRYTGAELLDRNGNKIKDL